MKIEEGNLEYQEGEQNVKSEDDSLSFSGVLYIMLGSWGRYGNTVCCAFKCM